MRRSSIKEKPYLELGLYQTLGDLANFHPHLHCLLSDRSFMPTRAVLRLSGNRHKKAEKLGSATRSFRCCRAKKDQQAIRRKAPLKRGGSDVRQNPWPLPSVREANFRLTRQLVIGYPLSSGEAEWLPSWDTREKRELREF